MNQFQYTLAMNKIPTLKTHKAKEEFAREIYEVLEPHGKCYSMDVKDDNIQTIVNGYKCLCVIIPLCTSAKGLPQFITTIHENCRISLLRRCTNTNNITYDEYIDMFQYETNELNFSNGYPSSRQPFIDLIGTNIQPYKIDLNLRATNQGTYSVPSFDLYTHNQLLTLEMYKDLALKSKVLTVVEDELKRLYSLVASLDTAAMLTDLDDITRSANLITSTIKARNEQVGTI